MCPWIVLEGRAHRPSGHSVFQLHLTAISKHRLVPEQVLEPRAPPLPLAGARQVGEEIGPRCGGNPRRGP